ncbi:MAG: hypothetical protein ACLQU4_07945 [Limisphaerales bacterium]
MARVATAAFIRHHHNILSEPLAYELASQNIVIKIVEPGGGATGTQFSHRMAQEKTADTVPADYADFMACTSAVFASMQAARKTTADDVARVIYDAATDGSSRLRCFVGEDMGDFVQAKREKSNQDFINFMRALFLMIGNCVFRRILPSAG